MRMPQCVVAIDPKLGADSPSQATTLIIRLDKKKYISKEK